MKHLQPTGSAAAAAEIYQFAVERITGIENRTWSKENIEAIISKHSPADKGTKKLVEALIEVKAECYGAVGREGLSNETCHLIDTALAEYEELNK